MPSYGETTIPLKAEKQWLGGNQRNVEFKERKNYLKEIEGVQWVASELAQMSLLESSWGYQGTQGIHDPKCLVKEIASVSTLPDC